MNKSSKGLRAVAAIFALVNIGGAIYAWVLGEGMHASVHAGLLAAGLVAWQFVPDKKPFEPTDAKLDDTRLDYLQQSVDAIAVEVERIGEKQRFQEKLMKKEVKEE